jgi:hypothetical protein
MTHYCDPFKFHCAGVLRERYHCCFDKAVYLSCNKFERDGRILSNGRRRHSFLTGENEPGLQFTLSR